jgi:hypothetical protein
MYVRIVENVSMLQLNDANIDGRFMAKADQHGRSNSLMNQIL